MYFSSSSSKFSRTKVVMVVMMPMKRLTQERVTKAEEGMENTKLAGYMRGTEDHLECKFVRFLFANPELYP